MGGPAVLYCFVLPGNDLVVVVLDSPVVGALVATTFVVVAVVVEHPISHVCTSSRREERRGG